MKCADGFPRWNHAPVVVLALLAGAAGQGGCVHDPLLAQKLKIDALEERCHPPVAWIHPLAPGDSEADQSASRTILRDHFSPQSLRLADLLGMTSALGELARLHEQMDASATSRLAFLEQRQHVTERLLLTSFDIDGTVAEIDCETSRADHLANGLEDARDRRIRTLTLVAIVGDALIGILAGGLSLAGEETAAAAAAITGGAIATGFGVAAVFGKTYHEFRHERNLLAEIWKGPRESTRFPWTVWRHLTLRNVQPLSPRETLLSHWQEEGFLGEASRRSPDHDATVPVFFSTGGRYELEELRTRTVMLNMVKDEVDAMHQALNLLMREVLMMHSER